MSDSSGAGAEVETGQWRDASLRVASAGDTNRLDRNPLWPVPAAPVVGPFNRCDARLAGAAALDHIRRDSLEDRSLWMGREVSGLGDGLNLKRTKELSGSGDGHRDPTRPKISVVIPTRNRRRFLVRALAAALAQHDATLEVIVVDDASMDDTREWLARVTDPRLRVITHDVPRGVRCTR